MKRSDLQRTAPITRTSRIERTPLKRRNAKHTAAAFDRAYGGADRADWITRQPCAICGHEAPSQNVHVKTGGMGRKADARWVIPGCDACHRAMHAGQKTFEQTHGIDLAFLAHIIDARWEVVRTQIDLFPEPAP